ncbi:MAG: 3-hydroxyacyl-CoA dehydrogenase NAD-binding domain-containing protein, partial [Bacteroidota bacterium]|nr:3-hydroxyacyl-CoA dehydrogenase NAD-binding domain-containing protein [Bacteroidota bacterium]
MKSIGVIGAGTMGSGIALASALAGYDVVLNDISDAFLQRAFRNIGALMEKASEKGKLSIADANAAALRIRTSSHFEHLKTCELVIEAAVEKLETKQEIFSRLSDICSDDTIF